MPTLTIPKRTYQHYGKHEVVSFNHTHNDFDCGMKEGQKSALMSENMESASATMLLLAIGYSDAARFLHGFREGYRIAKGHNGDWA